MQDQIVCRPRARGIELIESGGMTPTSVTTAVMLEGGVRSYNGLRISRFGLFSRTRVSGDFVRGKEEKMSLTGAVKAWAEALDRVYLRIQSKAIIPSSFFVKLSNCTPSLNLYVSQQTTTGTECCFAIMATSAVPAREYTAPFEFIE